MELFIQGLKKMPKGVYVRSEEYKKQRSIKQKQLYEAGVYNPNFFGEKRKPTYKGEKHHLWKGDAVGYSAIHSWIRRKLGKASRCVKCSNPNSKRYEWSNISGEYKRDVSDWQELCSRCNNLEAIKVRKGIKKKSSKVVHPERMDE